ncbi:MAG: C4-dicarboxylic acid transporter DauA [Chlamydiales bacterium]|nr:C4-dicarboxylic acid transporter DauA [Chlamydiales bacterium]
MKEVGPNKMPTQQSRSKRLKSFIPKSVQCLRDGYSLPGLRKDLLAGISVAVIAFPIALAVAIGADIPPERGLFTAIVAGFLISALGGSRVQVGGPSSTFIVILYGIMLRHGFEGMLLATMMAGVILIFFGLAGLGTYIKYIPYPVVTGLTTGIAVVIFSSQIKEFLGLHMGNVPVDFMGKWQSYWEHLGTWDPKALGLGIGTLAIIVYFRRFKPRFPGVIIALVAIGLITWIFQIDVPTIGSRYGSLPRTLPTPGFPAFEFGRMLNLVPDALTIALLAGMESLLAAVVAEGMTGWRHQSNCELLAQGVANIGSALFGGMPATGSLARTAANIKAGASTPVAGIVHAACIFLIMFLFAPLAMQLPLSALAAVLLMIAWNMSEIHHFLHLFTAPKKDVIVLLTVFILTVLINITAAVQVGMILAAFLFMKQMSDLSDVVATTQYFEENGQTVERSYSDPDSISRKEVPEGVEVYEINGPFFFGVADRLKNVFNELSRPPKIFILRMRRVPTIDASGMHALEEFFTECRRQGTLLLLAGVKKGPLRDLRRYHLDELIGEDHIFSHINSALEFSRELLRVEKFKKAMR